MQDRRAALEPGGRIAGERQRTLLLRAALEIVASNGYGAPVTGAVALRTGMSAQAVEDCFGSEAAMMQAVVVTEFARAERWLIAASRGGDTCAQVVRRYIRACLLHIDLNRVTVQGLSELRAGAWSTPDLRVLFREAEQRALSDLETILVLGQSLGEFGTFSTKLAAAVIRASIDAIPRRLRRDPDLDVMLFADQCSAAVTRVLGATSHSDIRIV